MTKTLSEYFNQRYFDLLWALTQKEFKIRYKRATLGLLWTIVNPLAQMLIIGFVFSLFINIPNHHLFLLSGLIPWQFFSNSISRTTTSFINARFLLQKAKFNKEIIPISIIINNCINLIISLTLLIIYLTITQQLVLSKVLYLVPAILWILIFTLGISLIFSTLNVRYRDTSFILQPLLVLWFYVTPIIYNLKLIPSSLKLLFRFNPLISPIELFHLSLIGNNHLDVPTLAINIITSLLVIYAGIYIFQKNQSKFTDWL